MLHIHRLPIIFAVISISLSACAAQTEISAPAATALPPTLTPSPVPTLTPTLTPEPTATEAPYDVDVETARQRAIIENAPNNIQEFSYLQSDEYLASLREKNAKGELPQISPNALCVQPGAIYLKFDDEPSYLFTKYGISSAIKIAPALTYKWQIRENRCWALADAGYTTTGEGFFVAKWGNQDKTEEFLGFTFIPTEVRSGTDDFKMMFDLNGSGYPIPAMFTSIKGCQKYFSSFSSKNVTDYCKALGENPESAIPKAALRQWNETGLLKLDFLPWAQPGTTPFK